MQIEQLPDYETNKTGNFGTSTILVDGAAHVVIDYYDKDAAIEYKVLKDGVEVGEPRALEIYNAYTDDLDNFVDEVLSNPPLEVVDG